MEEEEERLGLADDFRSLLQQVKQHENNLRIKRRWLIGLPLSRSEDKNLRAQNDGIVPECFLREDDVSYEIIKEFVENEFVENEDGECWNDIRYCKVEDNNKLLNSCHDIRHLYSLVDNMTNKGLCRVAEILTGSSNLFVKTRKNLKKIIKDSVSEVIGKQSDADLMDMSLNLSPQLTDLRNFCLNSGAHSIPDFKSCRTAVLNICDRLEDFSTATLSAMDRKLKGITNYLPQLQPVKRTRDVRRIDYLRRSLLDLLSELDEQDKLPEPLLRAMEVAALTMKLIKGNHLVKEFKQVSPEIDVIRNDIAMSVRLLNNKMVSFPVLKRVQSLLDPVAELSLKQFQTSLEYLLTEFLFECSEMDRIPKSLIEAIAIINQCSRAKNLSGDKNEGIECILNMSAEAKQLLWDMFPEHEFDLDFTDAYMDDPEDSDDSIEVRAKHSKSMCGYNDSDEEIESNWDATLSDSDVSASLAKEVTCSPVLTNRPRTCKQELPRFNMISCSSTESKSYSPPSEDVIQYHSVREKKKRNDRKNLAMEKECCDSEELPDKASPYLPSAEKIFMHDKQSLKRNHYLAVQTAVDEASMNAYRLIGRMSGKIGDCDLIQKNHTGLTGEPASLENDDYSSLFIRAVEEVMPSFPESAKERLKELMGSEKLY